MTCPYCNHSEQKVLDSRPARDGGAIRRRRECDNCGRRFTTFEEPEKPRLYLVKRDGTRELYDREKLMNSLILACGKRPVTLESLENAVIQIERDLFDQFDQEVDSTDLGDKVMEALSQIDPVGYIRFASVYLAFECPQQFAEMVRKMKPESKRQSRKSKVLVK